METAINERIRKLRNHLGISQKEMAEKLSVRQSYYSDIENSRRNVTNKFISKLEKSFKVSKDWIYTGKGIMITTDEQLLSYDDAHLYLPQSTKEPFTKIGEIRKEKFADSISKEDQNLISALKEIPELSEMVKEFINDFSIDELENLSSIGAIWRQGIKWNNLYEIKKDLSNEAYELNMKSLLHKLFDYRKSIIGIRESLLSFLKIVKRLDVNNKIKLPGKYLDEITNK